MFDGLGPLFERLLFSSTKFNMSASPRAPIKQPLLQSMGEIMNNDVLCQLAFFLKGDQLWRKVRRLYVGSEAGFSMGSFEQKVFYWRAPTILLVSGTRMLNPPESSRERAFTDTLAPKRYPDGVESGDALVFGAFLPCP